MDGGRFGGSTGSGRLHRGFEQDGCGSIQRHRSSKSGGTRGNHDDFGCRASRIRRLRNAFDRSMVGGDQRLCVDQYALDGTRIAEDPWHDRGRGARYRINWLARLRSGRLLPCAVHCHGGWHRRL